MQSGSYFQQFLYLLVYSSALISAAGVTVFRKKLGSEKPVGILLFAIAVCTSLLSIQVFINSTGILEHLDHTGAARVTLLMNMLVISSLAVIMYSVVAAGFTIRRADNDRLIRKTAAVISASALIPLLIVQGILLFTFSPAASALFSHLLTAGTVMFFAVIVFSTVRLFLPLRPVGDAAGLYSLRILFSALIVLPLLVIVAGGSFGAVAAPAGFTALNILSIITLYRLSSSADAGDSIEKAASVQPEDPVSSCRELGLSRRESEVAVMLAAGKPYKQIAADLFISMSTIQTHVSRIYTKLGINNKTELSNLIYYTDNPSSDKK